MFPNQLASSEKQDHCYLKYFIGLNTELILIMFQVKTTNSWTVLHKCYYKSTKGVVNSLLESLNFV